MEKVIVDSELRYTVCLENKGTAEEIRQLTMHLPECVDIDSIDFSAYKVNAVTWQIINENVDYQVTNNDLNWTYTLQGQETIYFSIILRVDKYVQENVEADLIVSNNNESISITNRQIAVAPAQISATIKTYINDNEIDNESTIDNSNFEELKYVIDISNTGEMSDYVDILVSTSEPFIMTCKREDEDEENEQNSEEDEKSNTIFMSQIEMLGESSVRIIATVKKQQELAETTDLVTRFKVLSHDVELTNFEKKNTIYVEEETTGDSGEGNQNNQEQNNNENHGNDQNNQEDNSENQGNQNSEQNENANSETQNQNQNGDVTQEEKTHKISGLAWLDKNKNGKRESTEPLLKGIEVKLTKLGDSLIEEVTTDINGYYQFTNIKNGEYVIIFEYDKSKYDLTISNNNTSENNINSDAVAVTTNDEIIIKTDVIRVHESDINNIDIGLILKETYDVKIDKYVSSIIVENDLGTNTTNFENTKLAKVEIPSKFYKGSKIIIEYKIIVKNIGDTAVYIYNIEDDMPKELSFSSELNTSWYQNEDKLYCIELSQEAIKPGDSRIIPLVLTGTINSDASAIFKNIVTIKESFNEESLNEKDIDNNMSEANAMITIKTGQEKLYIWVMLLCTIIIATGTFGVIYFTKNN